MQLCWRVSLGFALLALGGCGAGTEPESRDRRAANHASLAIASMAFSRTDAEPGDTILVAVEIDGSTPVRAIQGALEFSSAHLAWAGQLLEPGTLALMLRDSAGRAVQFVAVRPGPENSAAALAVVQFVVRERGYVNGLALRIAEAITADGLPLAVRVESRPLALRPVLAATVGRGRIVDDSYWLRTAAEWGWGPRPRPNGVSALPGEGKVYGDANLDGTINMSDLLLVAQATVGERPTVPGSGETSDVTLAGNVAPTNGEDGVVVGLSDPCPPGVECTTQSPFRVLGPGRITVADVFAIATRLLGAPHPVVGQPIPGRDDVGPSTEWSGALTSDATMGRAALNVVTGPLTVRSGATLTIEAGARVVSAAAYNSPTITIEAGAGLLAQGTLTDPIEFGCTALIQGQPCLGALRLEGAGGGALRRLRYVRLVQPLRGLEVVDGDAKASLEFIEVNGPRGVGILLQGGASRIRRLVVWGSAGPAALLRGTGGWAGTVQFGLLARGEPAGTGIVELDGAGAARLSNLTVTGPSPALVLGGRGGGIIENSIVANTSTGLSLSPDAAAACGAWTQGIIGVRATLFARSIPLGDVGSDPDACAAPGRASPDVEVGFLNEATSGNVTQVTDPEAGSLFVRAADLTFADYRPAPRGVHERVTPRALPADGFFEAVPYVGAVEPAALAQLSNLPWYAGWTKRAAERKLPVAIATLRVRVRNAAFGPIGGVQVTVRDRNSQIIASQRTGFTGDASFGDLPLGATAVEVRNSRGCSTTRDLVLVPGEKSIEINDYCSGISENRITSGDYHSCALSLGGEVRCWGSNGSGQLGAGTAMSTSTGKLLSPDGVPYTRVTAGGEHTCALTAAGKAYCWGNNFSGQLGDGTNKNTRFAAAGVLQTNTGPFVEIEAGGGHTCGVAASGVAYCWGSGISGQLGNAAYADQSSPEKIELPPGEWGDIRSISAGGAHTCATTRNRYGFCWGSNSSGQIGIGSSATTVSTPKVLSGGYYLISAGASHSCGASAVDGSAWCWGSNGKGEVGDATSGNIRSSPVQVSGGIVFEAIETGSSITCADRMGVAYCWGDNYNGKVGDGSTEPRPVPTAVAIPPDGAIEAIAPGLSHVCAIRSSEYSVVCWGSNSFGQLGDSSGTAPSPTLAAVPAGVTFAQAAAGRGYSCGVTVAGAAYCWGDNSNGQLGEGTTTQRLTPAQVFLLPAGGLTQLGAGDSHVCGVIASGAAYCWGKNSYGQIGDGTSNGDRLTPAAVAAPTGASAALAFAQVAAGGAHSCGRTAAGAAYCWGQNLFGQLGDATTSQRSRPVSVAAPSGASAALTFTQVATGATHTCGRTTAAAAYCWGNNDDGQLGDGTISQRARPVAVAAPAGTSAALAFAQLATGGGHTCGRTAAGAAYCWGGNSSGQLGDGTTTQRLSPVAVAAPAGVTFTQVATGSQHTCGLTAAGAAYCWGDNTYGQLGDGTRIQRERPVQVAAPAGVRFTAVTSSSFSTCGRAESGQIWCWGSNSSGQLGLPFEFRYPIFGSLW